MNYFFMTACCPLAPDYLTHKYLMLETLTVNRQGVQKMKR